MKETGFNAKKSDFKTLKTNDFPSFKMQFDIAQILGLPNQINFMQIVKH